MKSKLIYIKSFSAMLALVMVLGCGGTQGTKKDYKDNKKKTRPQDIPIPISIDEQVRLLIAAWRTAFLTKQELDNRLYAPQRTAGEAALRKLTSIAARGPKELNYALKDYQYKPDPARGRLDTITQPWVTCIKKYGDCDDSAWLCAALMPGAIYDIMEFRGKFPEGHLVFVTASGDVFSNFALDGRISDPRELGHKYNKNWTHIVKLTANITIESIIAR